MRWAKEEARKETLRYKQEQAQKQIQITFHADRRISHDQQVLCRGGYLFLQSVYYQLHMDKICRKLRDRFRFEYDINAILSDMIYARILEPSSKRSSYQTACEFLEKLRSMNFANIQEQGFVPVYTRDQLTDHLHKITGFNTDYEFITKSQMRNIQKKNGSIIFFVGLTLPRYRFSKPSASLDMNLRQCVG